MSELLNSLAPSGPRGAARLTVEPIGSRPFDVVWEDAEQLASALLQHHSPGSRLGVTLCSDYDSVLAVLAAVIGGFRLVSLPASSVSGDIEVDVRIEAFVEGLGTRRGRSCGSLDRSEPSAFRLVQYTSGTRGKPKGVCLTGSNIAACVDGTLNRLGVQSQEQVVSWLPMAHDMGLIGMFMAGWVGLDKRAEEGGLALYEPARFLRHPGMWLKACAMHKATITASSPRAIDVLAAAPRLVTSHDLSSLRCCIVGGSLVNPDSIARFEAALELDRPTVAPAYGCAEASLTVSMPAPGSPVSTITLDSASVWPYETMLGEFTWPEFVSLGPATDHVDVSLVADADGLPVIAVDGAQVMEGYVDGCGILAARSGPHLTGDVGFLHDEELVVLGRQADFLHLADGILHAPTIEAELRQDPELGDVVLAIGATPEGYGVLVGLPARRSRWAAEIGERVTWLGKALIGRPPSSLRFMSRSEIPLTYTGKLRRDDVSRVLSKGDQRGV